MTTVDAQNSADQERRLTGLWRETPWSSRLLASFVVTLPRGIALQGYRVHSFVSDMRRAAVHRSRCLQHSCLFNQRSAVVHSRYLTSLAVQK